MTVYSTIVAAEMIATPEQYNNLRRDILEGHSHSDNPINHGYLQDGIIAGTYLNHAKLWKHVEGTDTSEDPDDPGGNRGVHGLPPWAYVMGILTGAYVMQVGASVTDGTIAIGGDDVDQYDAVTFPTPFSSVPYVWVASTGSESVRSAVANVTTTGFMALLGYPNPPKSEQRTDTPFDWFAVGPL